MNNCGFDITNVIEDGMKSRKNVAILSIPILGEAIDVTFSNTSLSTEIASYETTTNNINNNSHNRAEMAIHNDDLDPISNWKTVSDEEENRMATSVYIGIHVGIGLIGVVLNGLLLFKKLLIQKYYFIIVSIIRVYI